MQNQVHLSFIPYQRVHAYSFTVWLNFALLVCGWQVWTERLREWMSSKVLQPLVAAVESAHTAPNALLAKYGQQARLPPLPSVVGGGFVGGAGAGAGHGQGLEIEAVLRHMQQVSLFFVKIVCEA